MTGLSAIPAWWWITMGALSAFGLLVLFVLARNLRSGAWSWRYRPQHAPRRLPVELPALTAAVPVKTTEGRPPWEIVLPEARTWESGPMVDDDAGAAGDVDAWLASLAEAPTVLDGLPREDGWQRPAVPPAAPALPPGAGDESEGFGLTAPPAPSRWAELDEFMDRMRADHVRWLAAARERWAVA